MFKFDPNSGVWRFLDRLGVVLVVNLLWLVGCLLILPVGPVTAALYATAHQRVVKGEGTTFRAFLEIVRANFRQAFIIGLLGLPIAAVCVLTFMVVGSQGWLVVGLALVIGSVLSACLYGWCLPLAVRFDNTTVAHLRNGLTLGMAHLPATLALALALPVTAVAVYYCFPVVFILPAAVMVAWSVYLERVFLRHGFISPVEEE